MPVMAKKSYDKILFGCEAKGPGLVVWGRFVVPGGNPVLGEPEYVEDLQESAMYLTGESEFEEGILKEGSVEVSVTLTAQWATDDRESHNLAILLVSAEETMGIYGCGKIDSAIIHDYLLVGCSPQPSGYPDPEFATLDVVGIYENDDGTLEISGRGYLLAADYVAKGVGRIRVVHLSLWIEELETYVTFLWLSREGILYWDSNPAGGGTISELATIPAAKVLKIHIKLI
jgi:hypothetical protein